MATKKKTTSATSQTRPANQPYYLPSDASWGGFINIRLDDNQKAEFLSWYEKNYEVVNAAFVDMLGVGLKATFSFDAEHDCFICAIQGALVSEAGNDRFVSTSRASSLIEAIGLTVWKHTVLARGDYGAYRPKSGSFMSWG